MASLNSPADPARPGSVISIYGTGGSTNAVRVAISNEIIAFLEVDGGVEDYRYYAPVLYAGLGRRRAPTQFTLKPTSPNWRSIMRKSTPGRNKELCDL
jgi:hypothetical protein